MALDSRGSVRALNSDPHAQQSQRPSCGMHGVFDPKPVAGLRSAYQPLSERTSHQQSAATSQQYYSLRTNQHQPSATSQPNRLLSLRFHPLDRGRGDDGTGRDGTRGRGNFTSLSLRVILTRTCVPCRAGPVSCWGHWGTAARGRKL
jgi:hypothetical protein